LTADGFVLRRRALKNPADLVEHLGVDLDPPGRLPEVLTRMNAAAVTAGAIADGRRDR
jgi:MarR family transcriptional regulator, organic hydroperoxide resistance regulator